jgi:prolyl oligopeptidase
MMGADHDDRVDPMHARKFVAAIQNSGSPSRAWLRIEANAGHGGSDQVGKTIDASADQLSFLFEELKMTVPGTEGAEKVGSLPAK